MSMNDSKRSLISQTNVVKIIQVINLYENELEYENKKLLSNPN